MCAVFVCEDIRKFGSWFKVSRSTWRIHQIMDDDDGLVALNCPVEKRDFFYARNAVSCEGCSSIVRKFSPLVTFCSATKRKCFSANDIQGG